MKERALSGWAIVIGLSLLGLLTGCNTTTNSNENMNANAPANTNRLTPTPIAEATRTPAMERGQYTEEQARQEREKAKRNKETVGQSLDDAWLHTKIVAKLISDTKTPERDINVDVVDGAVTLRGQVDTAQARTEAERDARDTEGVKKVTNELKVVPAKSASEKNSNANPNKGMKH